ncbi:MAG TPA: hypothetical protein VJU14_08630 [Solirubrobacterales bacterium]|nr:hypothetical protein [Solirubrobacterales bacterium]
MSEGVADNPRVANSVPMPTIWRTKLRSLKPGVDHQEQVDHNFDDGIVGIGWGIEGLPDGATLDDVLAAIDAEPDWTKDAVHTVRRFGEAAQIGDYIWTRDLHGRFRLGRITGPYRYENTELAKRTDTHQVRDCEWADQPLSDLEVPGAVIRGFVGTSTSFSRMWDEGARTYTAWLWEKLQGRDPAPLSFTHLEVLRQLEPYDLEDLVYTWMQVAEDYLALPKARRTDTPAYEWTMLNRKTFMPAIVQVKSGDQAVDLEALAAAAPDAETVLFACSASGQFKGNPPREVRCVYPDALVAFVREHERLLPPRVRTWFELAAG